MEDGHDKLKCLPEKIGMTRWEPAFKPRVKVQFTQEECFGSGSGESTTSILIIPTFGDSETATTEAVPDSELDPK